MISAGEFVEASGSWINDRTHGVQFRASFLKATVKLYQDDRFARLAAGGSRFRTLGPPVNGELCC
jgi:hypothetical protein